MKSNNIIKALYRTGEQLARRIKDADKWRDESVATGKWSQISGYDGIGTGLRMALFDINDEIKRLQGKPVRLEFQQHYEKNN